MLAQLNLLALSSNQILIGLICTIAGGAVAWYLQQLRQKREAAARQAEIARIMSDAQDRAAERLKAADVEAEKRYLEAMARFEKETAETRNELKAFERRLDKRDDQLEKKLDVLGTKERKIDSAEQELTRRQEVVDKKQHEVEELLEQQRAELMRISRLGPDQARDLCLQKIETEVEKEAGQLVERIITHAEENAQERARYIILSAIQRYAAEHTCEAVVATVEVPSDEMKGRVIGREGRNIRAFEKATGVTVIVDDTPGIIQVSIFDPVRREIARQALERLIRDGRIHPTRIEEVVAQVTKEVEKRVIEAGKEAAAEANVDGVHKKVLEILGRLAYRTSYGQNVLKHSIEVAYLCGLMAEELGLDGPLARRCGLLHDIGKAIDHEGEGSHTKVGYDLARRFNEPPAVLNAIQGHHGDVAATHPYTPLVTAADAISAARPGSRRESIELYMKRLEKLEEIATSFRGVQQAYAIEAGREVRVIVDAIRVDDRSSLKLARDIALKIEDEVERFPGEIKVTVLREVRATEYAISGRHRSNGDRAEYGEERSEDAPVDEPVENTDSA